MDCLVVLHLWLQLSKQVSYVILPCSFTYHMNLNKLQAYNLKLPRRLYAEVWTFGGDTTRGDGSGEFKAFLTRLPPPCIAPQVCVISGPSGQFNTREKWVGVLMLSLTHFFLFCQKKSNQGEIGFRFFLMVFFFGKFF